MVPQLCRCRDFSVHLPRDNKTHPEPGLLWAEETWWPILAVPLSLLPKSLQGSVLRAVMGSPPFAEKEKRERSMLEGEGPSSPSSEAAAHPDARKSPPAELGLGLGNSPRAAGLPLPGAGSWQGFEDQRGAKILVMAEMLPSAERLGRGGRLPSPSISPLNTLCSPSYAAPATPNLFGANWP